MDEWIYLFKNSAIKSDFKAKGIKKAGRVLDKMKMSKEELLAYDDYIYHKRAARGDFQTALDEVVDEKNKQIKQLEDNIQKKDSVIQEKDNVIQEKDNLIQEKDNKLQQLAKMLLSRGFTKKEIFEKIGIRV